ncbi:MAG TPA: toprim domain-containing protein [Chitinophaga sp.]|uniref:toprim domain-containing protein n=1 Tax=Chitinophaga sp. TaxID=1869181 RepID=UPI002C333F62|nr:toprim domain-containing protein [Chitinophaga sp.]HVI49228.1 toprim domain-containing protein [Chitinophaga sp.]
MNIRQLNEQIAITDFLAKEGFIPIHRRGDDWWYISPIRDKERTASFKVNIKRNRWYDHGIGNGGRLFDLALCLYPGLTNVQVLEKVQRIFFLHQQKSISDPPPFAGAEGKRLAGEEKKILVTGVGPIVSPALIRYLGERCIPRDIASKFCCETTYTVDGRSYYAIGFKNDAGGYELRNPGFKGSSSPKSSTLLNNDKDGLAVFEGFFSFLSFLTAQQYHTLPSSNYLVLNSLAFFEKSKLQMEQHSSITLYLDRDPAGLRNTEKALKDSPLYKDGSDLYQGYKDLNEWLVKEFYLLQQHSLALNPTRKIGICSDKPSKKLRNGGKNRFH